MAVAAAIAALLSILLIGGGGDIFARRTTLTTFMPDGSGISGESIVRLNGISIGRVRSFGLSGKLDPQRAVKVELRVVSGYLSRIPTDSQTHIDADTLVGAPFIDINPGRSPVPIQANGVLESEPVQQADIRADQLHAISVTFRQIDELLATVLSYDTVIGQFVNSEEAYDIVDKGVGDFDRGLHRFITPQNALGQALYSSAGYADIRKVILNTDGTLEAIQDGEGTLGHALRTDSQYEDAIRSIRNLRATLADLNTGKGGFGILLRDANAHQQLAALLGRIAASLDSLNASSALESAQLYESLDGSLRELDSLLKDVEANPKKYLRYKR